MTTAIERHDGAHIAQLNVAEELPSIFQLAKALKQAQGFLPSHLKNEGEIVAVILAGRELGIGPMASIRGIFLVKGRVTLDASLQLGCMMRVGGKVQWEKDGSDGEAVATFTRPGHPPFTSRYTIKMAQAAQLTGSDTWKKHPAAMLRARCVTAAGKAYFADALAGVYLPDELDDVRDDRPARQQRAAPTRTLDDVASEGDAPDPRGEFVEIGDSMGPFSEPGDDHQPSHDPNTGEVIDAAYELTPPDGECPTFSSGPDAGKRYDAVPAGKLRALIAKADFREKAPARSVQWMEYLVAKHEMEKTA